MNRDRSRKRYEADPKSILEHEQQTLLSKLLEKLMMDCHEEKLMCGA